MATLSQIKILLVEDDPDDYILVRAWLAEISPSQYTLQWESSYEAGLAGLRNGNCDVCLLDYGLGARTGLELLQQANFMDYKVPIIFLTGEGVYQVDVEAMKAGASDYLVKSQISAPLLERSIRYAIERKRTEEELRKSHQQLRALSVQLLSAQEDERKRIAKELHDGIGQILTAVKFGVENSLQAVACKDSSCHQSLHSVISLIQGGIDEVRRISRDLWPAMMNEFGVLSTINWYCREFQNVFSGMRIEKAIEISEADVPDCLKITIYRILQEATNNAAKHSKGDVVTIALRKKSDCLQLSISDNGRGFSLAGALPGIRTHRGLGLSSMRERAELSGGSFSLESIPGKGTVVTASWDVTTELTAEASNL